MRLDGRGNGIGHRGAVVVLVGLLFALIQSADLTAAGAESPSPDDERARFVAAINRSRAELAGAGPLRPVAELDAVADRHAALMAERGAIFHNPTLAAEVPRWESVGENVGVGPDVAALHLAFLESPAHRTNLLDDRYLEVGIGVARRDGHLWVVEVFRRELPAGAVVTFDPEPAPVVPDAATAAAARAERSVRADAGAVAPPPVPEPVQPAVEVEVSPRLRTASVLPLAWALVTVAVLLAAAPALDRTRTGGGRRPVTA